MCTTSVRQPFRHSPKGQKRDDELSRNCVALVGNANLPSRKVLCLNPQTTQYVSAPKSTLLPLVIRYVSNSDIAVSLTQQSPKTVIGQTGSPKGQTGSPNIDVMRYTILTVNDHKTNNIRYHMLSAYGWRKYNWHFYNFASIVFKNHLNLQPYLFHLCAFPRTHTKL